jgi:hypothetical protein
METLTGVKFNPLADMMPSAFLKSKDFIDEPRPKA